MVLDRGHAYQAGGAVYFDVTSFPGFGEVSNYSHDEMIELARERGGNVDDPNKRNPLDFVLWQPSADGRADVGDDVGARPSRVAHRVLGARAPRARHDDRSARRRRPT